LETTTLHSLAGSQAVIAWILIILGILSIGFSLFFLMIIKYSFFKGLAVVLLLAGMFQLGRGSYTLATCRDAHFVIQTNGTVTDEEAAFINARMQQIGNFTWIALAGAAIGLLLFIAFFKSSQTFWKGIGLGMMIQGALSGAMFGAEIMELRNCKASLSQGIALQDEAEKKIKIAELYSDFS
jgi:hypothetical protein